MQGMLTSSHVYSSTPRTGKYSQWPVNTPMQIKSCFPKNSTIDSSLQEKSLTQRKGLSKETKKKLAFLFYGIVSMSIGAYLLYRGFHPAATAKENKVYVAHELTTEMQIIGVMATLSGLFCFIIGVYLFVSDSSLCNNNQNHTGEEAGA